MNTLATALTKGIRVDTAAQKGSLIDIIRIVNLNLSSAHAGEAVANLQKANPELNDIDRLEINDKGHLTPVTDGKTLMETVYILPGKAAHEFRRSSARTMCRVLVGDVSIVKEMEGRHASLQATPEGRAAQEFLLTGAAGDDGTSATKKLKTQSDELAMATPAQRGIIVDLYIENKRRELAEAHARAAREDDRASREAAEAQVGMLQRFYFQMNEIGVLDDDRDKIQVNDSMKIAMLSIATAHYVAAGSTSTAIVSSSTVPPDDPRVPTPECHHAHRGREI
jgi:hypothetical protein